jgi:putative endonuclease
MRRNLKSGYRQQVGRWGEDAAAKFLQERGDEIIARNVRTPYGEIDLIARRADVVVFVEVKARTTRSMGLPEESITPRKLAYMLAAAEHYAAEHEIDHWQLDAISVEGKPGGKPTITHFENVGG